MSPTQRRALTVDDPIAGAEAGHEARLAESPSDALGRLREISVRSIHPNPNQPRKHFDQATLSALADSIRARGVLQPIVVRPTSPDAFELVAGERRWRAALIAGDLVIPALIDDKGTRDPKETGSPAPHISTAVHSPVRTDGQPTEPDGLRDRRVGLRSWPRWYPQQPQGAKLPRGFQAGATRPR
jgi:hypothetical protein